MKILSFGAGMQSTALALMSCENAIRKTKPYPQVPIYDAVVFCDLGLEPSWVQRQMEFTRRSCESAGIPFYRLDTPLYQDFMKNFDTNDVVGKTAMLKVKLKENGYNDITMINPIPDGFPVPVPSLPLIRFDMEPWDQTAFDSLPEWAKRRIKKSTQYQKEHVPVTDVTINQEPPAGGVPF